MKDSYILEFSEGEVLLLFETYQFTDNPLEDPIKCGEGKFLVFPCAGPMPSDQPSTSTASRDVCYNYTTQIAINKRLPEEQLYVNVGHIQITVLLKIDLSQGRSGDELGQVSSGGASPSSIIPLNNPHNPP